MIKNYIKTAWRSLARNKSYATINVLGLAIGIAACILIFLIVQFETTFDNFHSQRDHIYRVITRVSGADGISMESGTPLPLSDGLRNDFPQLKQVAAIFRNDGTHYTITGGSQQEKKFEENDAYYVEPQFFNIFDFAWLAGDKKTALSEPNTMVLTQDEATRFFGDWHNAMGKTVLYEAKTGFKVTGILKNPPLNTDIPLKLLMSYATMRVKSSQFYGNLNDWVSTFGDNNCYVILPGNLSKSTFDNELKAFVTKHKPAQYRSAGFVLQPLSEMHYNEGNPGLYSHYAFSKSLIKIISLIGMFLLMIACVNFINLSTAQAINRSKEVGIRKVLGSDRNNLFFQFISETLIITLFAVVLGIGIAEASLPFFNQLLDIPLSAAFVLNPVLLLFIVALIVSVTLLAGCYPALVLSGFNPINALKNKVAAGKATGVSLRRALVVLQFCIAQFLVIGTLVIVFQMDYFRNKSLGFDKDAIVNVPFPGDTLSHEKLNTVRDQILQIPGVKDMSYSFGSPTDLNGWGSDFKFDNAPKPVNFNAALKWADAEYFKLYHIQFVAGNVYPAGDTIRGWVVNETLIHKLGITDPNKAIGKYIQLWDDKTKNAQIVGVVKDFNISSLKNAIQPVLLGSWKDVYQKLNIKLQSRHVSQTMAAIEKVWNKDYPQGMFEYKFLDDKIAEFYKSEDQQEALCKIFAGLAIFISCLGLYGLVSFMAVQRTKEVGIRKTLGASVSHIVYLFSREFTILIGVAFAIAAPLGWYLMQMWLRPYTYRITMGPTIFILAILASIIIAWLTVGYKAVKAALANPVKSLRSE